MIALAEKGRPILQIRGTSHDGLQEEPVRRANKEESSQKTWVERQQLRLGLHTLLQDQASGSSRLLKRTFQWQKEKWIQPQSNSQSLPVN